MEEKPFTLVMIGPPHSGKSTLSGLLAQRAGFKIIDVGEILRRIIATEPKHNRSELIRTTVKSGQLLPDEVACEIFVEQAKSSGEQGLVTDGFPRTSSTVECFLGAMENLNRSVANSAAVSLHISKDSIWELLRERGREDDLDSAVISKRISMFEANFAPTLEKLDNVMPIIDLQFEDGIEENYGRLSRFIGQCTRT